MPHIPKRRVYPRPRGGTDAVLPHGYLSPGLSPPTRGNLPLSGAHGGARRSIPAHAGEPGRHASTLPGSGGLSPPTRGNLFGMRLPASPGRSIPAHAGEPRSAFVSCPTPAVYPRPRGGTIAGQSVRAIGRGLSPPTRGNRTNSLDEIDRLGSIPAHAGEPDIYETKAGRVAVYPRPRGGTNGWYPLGFGYQGLSPPTRGNRNRRA